MLLLLLLLFRSRHFLYDIMYKSISNGNFSTFKKLPFPGGDQKQQLVELCKITMVLYITLVHKPDSNCANVLHTSISSTHTHTLSLSLSSHRSRKNNAKKKINNLSPRAPNASMIGTRDNKATTETFVLPVLILILFVSCQLPRGPDV